MNNANEPAFPITPDFPGVTKREYFAGLAMSCLAMGIYPDEERQPSLNRFAKTAVDLADALLVALEASTPFEAVSQPQSA